MTRQKAELAIDAEKNFADFESNESPSNETYLGKIIQEIGEIVKIEELQNGNISFALVDEMFGVTCTMDSFF